MKTFALLFFPFFLFASQILSYNIYDRSDRVDIMLTFDTPYEGIIRQQKRSGTVIVKLTDAHIDSAKKKRLNSPFLSNLTITPIAGEVQVVAQIPQNVTMQASKTADGYGLRLRFKKATALKNGSDRKTQQANPLASLPTKQDTTLEDNFVLVILILVIGIVILLWLRAFIGKKSGDATKPSILKNGSKQTDAQKNEATIRFQKQLDAHNSVLMLDYGNVAYLVIVGTSNLMLDRFVDDIPSSMDDFDAVLQKEQKKIEDIINPQQEESRVETIPFQERGEFENYKDKASHL